jgi:thermitase
MRMDELFAYLRENKVKPKRRALVAILDTGVDATHEDIKANFKSIASKHNKDPHRHGTHCAGIAASVSNNGKGVASFSHDNTFVRVSSVRVLSPLGSGTQRGIINGMLEAADNGADVISMSLGGRSTQSAQRAYQKAVKYATDKNAIVVAAAGNSNRNARDYSPVNVKGVLGVSALDPDLNRAIFSNSVQDIDMAVAAPGVDILSTVPGDKYAKFSGTSMATPYVAGLLGLLKSLNPDLTTREAYDILHGSGAQTQSTRETGRFIQPLEAVKGLR